MKKRIVIPYLIGLLALVIGAFQDYQITDFLYHPASWFGLFFERIILIPVLYVVVVTCCMVYRKYKHVVFLILAEAMSFYIIYDALHYWMSVKSMGILLIIGVISIVVLGITVFITSRLSMRVIDQCLPKVIFFTCVLVGSFLLTTCIKFAWGRIRYRDIEDVATYCVWYQPCGMFGNASFPSGHTTAFTVILCLLQWVANPYKKTPLIQSILIWVFVILMPLSRMIMGAHFLSDTAMGFMITYSFYLLFVRLFKKRGIL